MDTWVLRCPHCSWFECLPCRIPEKVCRAIIYDHMVLEHLIFEEKL